MEYDLEDVICEITEKGYSRVAIQSSSIKVSHKICDYLQNTFRENKIIKFYILGDVLTGSCCIDLIATKRCNADFIIYVGESCHSIISVDVPTRFIHEKKSVDVSRLSHSIIELASGNENILLLYHSSFDNKIVDVAKELLKHGMDIYIAKCIGSNVPANTLKIANRIVYKFDMLNSDPVFTLYESCGRVFNVVVLLNTEDNIGLRENIMLEVENDTIYEIIIKDDLMTSNIYDTNSIKIKRYKNVDKVRSATTVGIITLTKCIRGINELRNQLYNLVIDSGKKCYLFSINHLKEAKLTNFPSVDVFCLLSCPYTLLSLPDELSRHITAPFELLVALDVIDWSNTSFILDLDRLSSHIVNNAAQSNCDVVSDCTADNTAVRRIYNGTELSNFSREFYDSLTDNSKRTFRGVDPTYDNHRTTGVIKGSHGVPNNYEHELAYK